MHEPAHNFPGLHRLYHVVQKLRDPDGGCPWDLKQTHASLRPFVLEEAYELVEAITEGDTEHMKEELGDVLLQVFLHAQIASDENRFTVDDVAGGIADKLVRRHPHVFGDVQVNSAEEVTDNWRKLKAAERGETETPKESAMDGVPQGIPALSRALKVSRRAVREGFEWPNFESLWACVLSEFDEFKHERDTQAPFDQLEDEMGDILFASVNLARFHNIDPEVALHRATEKFMRRYRKMEQLTESPLNTLDFDTLDALWAEAKRHLQSV